MHPSHLKLFREYVGRFHIYKSRIKSQPTAKLKPQLQINAEIFLFYFIKDFDQISCHVKLINILCFLQMWGGVWICVIPSGGVVNLLCAYKGCKYPHTTFLLSKKSFFFLMLIFFFFFLNQALISCMDNNICKVTIFFIFFPLKTELSTVYVALVSVIKEKHGEWP